MRLFDKKDAHVPLSRSAQQSSQKWIGATTTKHDPYRDGLTDARGK